MTGMVIVCDAPVYLGVVYDDLLFTLYEHTSAVQQLFVFLFSFHV